jgi:NAD(P)-dependent dehydrogenase (short-subunit alcohol dehydrogenase family)
MSQLHLAGKTALVTGSTSGIGLGLAIALAKEGANIVMNGFGDVAGPKAEIEACKVKVAHHPADMSKASDIQDMMEFATKNFGGVDILVNNAGIQHVASVESFPVEKWDAIIAINLTSAFHNFALSPALYAPKELGTHHQCRVCARVSRFGPKVSLCGRQTRDCGIDQSHCTRNCYDRCDLQCDMPWLGADPIGSKTSRRQSS